MKLMMIVLLMGISGSSFASSTTDNMHHLIRKQGEVTIPESGGIWNVINNLHAPDVAKENVLQIFERKQARP